MLDVYADFVENWMAVPVIKGVKSPNERFAGAEDTYCIEALMQDGKALQAGTSHFLGQNFAKAFDVKFSDKENKLDYVWATSWGVSTRLIGALVMAHSDDDGLILPPKIAPIQVVIVPIYKGDEQKALIDVKAHELVKKLKGLGISVKYDNSDNSRPGWKFAEYEMKGIPVRMAIGARDMQNNVVEVARRDTKEKQTKVRILTRISKVGHAGTLDPLATGLLIVCTGKFTKKINEYMGMEKEYTGTFTLGAVTRTYDLESADLAKVVDGFEIAVFIVKIAAPEISGIFFPVFGCFGNQLCLLERVEGERQQPGIGTVNLRINIVAGKPEVTVLPV
eukprot:jgi/Mesen1/3027/ME001781S02304